MVEFRNQTVTYLKRKFRDIGIRPVSKHGQNFLIDMNILDLLVRSAQIAPEDYQRGHAHGYLGMLHGD